MQSPSRSATVLCMGVLTLGAVWLYWISGSGTADDLRPNVGDGRELDTAGGPEGSGAQPRPREPADKDPWAGRTFKCSIADFAQEQAGSDEEQIERAQSRLHELTESLAASSDFEHRLTAGILKVNTDRPDAIDDFEELLITMPEDPVLHWRLLDACDVRQTHPLCQSGEAEARVIRVLGSNGEAWAKVAHYRIKRGDEAGGLEALYNASSAAQFNDHWSAEVALLFRGLAIDTNQAVPARLVEAVGYVAAFPAPELGLVNQCRLRATESQDWQRACLAYARRKESDARTMIGKGIGIGLQRAVFAATGQPEEAEAALAREEPIMTALRDPLMRDGEILIAYDETIAIGWLQQLTTYGEFAAQEFLRSEVERVGRIPGYAPCPTDGARM